MNILILGCSFGVPNYHGPPGANPEDHTEYLLKKSGHTVFNCARNAGSNLDSLHCADKFLSGKPIPHPVYRDRLLQTTPGQSIDWIVWFHTELFRDLGRLSCPSGKFVSDAKDLAHLTYSKYQNFQQQQNAKLAAIGGAGDLHESFSDYFNPNFVIPSWRSEILNINTVTSHTLWQRDYFYKSKDLTQDKIKTLEDDLALLALMQNSDNFPDNYHPGATPHKHLVERLLQAFQHD